MSGRRCGLGERCKRSQRLQLDLACEPRCRLARPHPPLGQTPVSRHRKGLREPHTPHIAQNATNRTSQSTLERHSHPGYEISQQKRKRTDPDVALPYFSSLKWR
jgi:hypothetical protein